MKIHTCNILLKPTIFFKCAKRILFPTPPLPPKIEKATPPHARFTPTSYIKNILFPNNCLCRYFFNPSGLLTSPNCPWSFIPKLFIYIDTVCGVMYIIIRYDTKDWCLYRCPQKKGYCQS